MIQRTRFLSTDVFSTKNKRAEVRLTLTQISMTFIHLTCPQAPLPDSPKGACVTHWRNRVNRMCGTKCATERLLIASATNRTVTEFVAMPTSSWASCRLTRDRNNIRHGNESGKQSPPPARKKKKRSRPTRTGWWLHDECLYVKEKAPSTRG